jgi:indolepyruvate ferredoxin oxidoreductase
MTEVLSRRHALVDLTAKYQADEGEFFFTGVQALVRVPFEQLRADRRAGLRTAGFVSGYPGSPLGGYDREILAQRTLLDELGIVIQPGLNEELAATAVMGSQVASAMPTAKFDGVVGVWYGKHPGVDRASDAIRHAAYGGASAAGGVLCLAGDDPSSKSSSLPCASEFTLADLHVPVLSPGTIQELLDFGRHGIALSRSSGLWAGLKVVTAVADGSGNGTVDADRIHPVNPAIEYQGKPYVPSGRPLAMLASVVIEQEIYEARLPLARMYAEQNAGLNEITVDPGDAWLGIVAGGRTYYEVRAALELLGLSERDLRGFGIRLLRLGMLYPLDGRLLRRFAKGLREIVVVEEKRPFLEAAIKEALYGMSDAPAITGKSDPRGAALVPAAGALDAKALVEPLRRRLAERIDPGRLSHSYSGTGRRLLPIAQSRTPYFCSGCPHSTGTKAPEGAWVGAGIGCHGMAPVMDSSRVGDVVVSAQMGGDGTPWLGIAPFVEKDHLIQNIGDGTYFHSGQLAVRAAIAAGSHMTYKILYNAAVAMTGGQDAQGAMPVPALAASLLLEGVNRVIITTDDTGKYRHTRLPRGVRVLPRSKIVQAQEELRLVPGVTVLIHDQQCAAELRRDRKRGKVAEPPARVIVNDRVCEGCGDCGRKSNCLSVQSVQTEFGSKTKIHQSSCNKDYSCLDGDCPSFLTVVPRKAAAAQAGSARGLGGARRRPPLKTGDIPAPGLLAPAGHFVVRLPGIGGTGVVTVAQIIGTAAMLDGCFVSGLDQTGLSQKAGPVLSDLTISRHPLTGSEQASAAQADTYLVLDMLVGLDVKSLAAVVPDRTVAVVSTSQTPTGRMVAHGGEVAYPSVEGMRAELDARTRARDNLYLDAERLALGLFGEATTSNLIVLGAAVQHGCVPIAPEAIEQAIGINGVAVEANRLAFRWGRMWVADPGRVAASMLAASDGIPRPTADDLALIGDLDHGALGAALRVRVPDLIAYQDRSYARQYVQTVREVALAERRIGADDLALATAAAQFLHRFMAYKDEYEVARLHLLPSARAAVVAEAGTDVKVSYNLHPPILRSLGLRHKLRLGPWFRHVLRLLAAMKGLRGTPFDIFGYAEIRRTERELVTEFSALLAEVAQALTPGNREQALELIRLADAVRGYEDIKMNNVRDYRQRVSAMCGELFANENRKGVVS